MSASTKGSSGGPVSAAHRHLGADGDPDPYTPGVGCCAVTVEHYDLDLDYDVEDNGLEGRAILTCRALRGTDRVELDLTELAVTEARFGGGGLGGLLGARKVGVHHSGSRLVLVLPRVVAAGEAFTLTLSYEGWPESVDGPWGEIGWTELDDGVLVAGQPTGASTWFPCVDHPSHRATYRVTVHADADYEVVVHGELESVVERDGERHWVYASRVPLPAYLATVLIGPYGRTELGGSRVPQYLVCSKKRRKKAEKTFADQARMIDVFTDWFGPYPFPSYTVVVVDETLDEPFECFACSVFGKNELGTDWDEQRLVAHELAHQWFGNSLVLASWQDIWLNEGFASYAEWIWSEASGDRPARWHAEKAHKTLSKMRQDLVIGDPGRVRLFDDVVYVRGALTVHALREAVGDDAFRVLLRSWVAAHRDGWVSTAQFRAHLREVVPEQRWRELDGLLDAWLMRPELPALP
ncbi:M1 family metallopeptidase [Kocuria sp. M1R5S2]|uniref:M1 family metallopeptidase n=1 Tax=Kocuria rhizosphaerae TaxID=3376285 RepID=UPI0037B94203